MCAFNDAYQRKEEKEEGVTHFDSKGPWLPLLLFRRYFTKRLSSLGVHNGTFHFKGGRHCSLATLDESYEEL